MGIFDITGYVDNIKETFGMESDKKSKYLSDGISSVDKADTGENTGTLTGLTDTIAEAKKLKAEMANNARTEGRNALGIGNKDEMMTDMQQAVNDYFS